ncbi:hypothetical protein [Aestuariivirga litoralis]|uniref:hypothetical protein n=1 Tax=Aestuariivirga litoralis TaxID=2650924 RepID=UPI0011B85266|nr:hypothetical protein [Aestuariivirga litoralis]
MKGESFMQVFDANGVLRGLLGYMDQPKVALTAFIVCVGIACAALLGVWVLNRRDTGLKCHWQKDAVEGDGGMTRWICSACSGISFSNGEQPPIACRAHDPRSKKN